MLLFGLKSLMCLLRASFSTSSSLRYHQSDHIAKTFRNDRAKPLTKIHQFNCMTSSTATTPNLVYISSPILSTSSRIRIPNQSLEISPRARDANFKSRICSRVQTLMATSRHSRTITTLIYGLAWDNHPVKPRHASIVENCCLGSYTVVGCVCANTPFFNHDVFALGGALVCEFGEVSTPLLGLRHVAVDGEDVNCGAENI